MKILITGGTGYIGSHCALELLNQKHDVVLLDNLSNSSDEICNILSSITKTDLLFYRGDINDRKLLEKIFITSKIDAVIHCAGLKAVSESVAEPIKYHQNNVDGSKNLISVMEKHKVYNLVFSSSATVYGDPKYLPIDECHPLNPLHPYGENKIKIEELLRKSASRNSAWKILSLRYFNPVGAHDSYLLGDNPLGIPNNLFPFMMRVASKEINHLQVFGDNYDTRDGTGVRDYIHIMDLIDGHISALLHLEHMQAEDNYNAINLGTGKGYTVLEILKKFEEVNNLSLPFVIESRRDGDVASSYANIEKAATELQWKAKRSLEEMCSSAWNFQKLFLRSNN